MTKEIDRSLVTIQMVSTEARFPNIRDERDRSVVLLTLEQAEKIQSLSEAQRQAFARGEEVEVFRLKPGEQLVVTPSGSFGVGRWS